MQPIKIIFTFIKSIFTEFSIVFIYILSINMFLGNVNETIKSDAEGYYDYLPSIFIYDDINRKDFTIDENPLLYKRISERTVYLDYEDGYKVNKYPCGTALLQLPFFIYTSLTTDRDGSFEDGFQLPFQKTVFHAAIFYLFLGLFFVKKLLKLYDIKWYIIVFLQLLITMSTAITNYANFDAGYSHIYSFFAITAFLFFMKYYLTTYNLSKFLLASFFLGLIIIIRQINIIVLFFAPFLAGSLDNLKLSFMRLLKNPKYLILGIMIVCAIFAIQSSLWYLQTKKIFIYSYQNEGFNFLQPNFLKVLFSYRKGLFVYTPVLFIATLCSISLFNRRQYYLFITWITFFLFITYIISSWWVWDYGACYSQRVYIDFYTVFFIPFALVLNKNSKSLNALIVSVSVLTIPINIIQTKQYKNHILHWSEMTKDKYWKVFLRTAPMYRGFLWVKNHDYSHYQSVGEKFIGDVQSTAKTEQIIWQSPINFINNFEKVSLIKIRLENNFKDNDKTKIIMRIYNPKTNKNIYWHNPFLLHFEKHGLNKYHEGYYGFELKPVSDNENLIISVSILGGNRETLLKNMKLTFLSDSTE